MNRVLLSSTGFGALLLAGAAAAQAPAVEQPATATTPAPAAAGAPGSAANGGGATSSTATPAAITGPASTGSDIVVTARRLDAARASIQPSLGASSYTVTNATIQALPGGENQPLDQIVLQLPGVVQDGFGQFHVRADHNGLQYRINGTILPEGIAVFGQTLSPRLVETFNLLTGALPAQYGLRTAGVIDITTKSGFRNGGVASLYGGTQGTFEPSLEYGGTSGSTNYYVAGNYRQNKVGIESVDGSSVPIHDKTKQIQAFTYLDHIIDEDNRVSLVGGYSDQRFQIPNPRGLQPDLGYSVGGQTDFLSDDLDERQHERTAFGQLAFLHHTGAVTLQASLFARYSSLVYTPDITGELLFNGQAQAATKRDLAVGAQVEGVYRLSEAHTLRGGVIVSRDRGTSRTATSVFPLDATGAQAGAPIVIPERGGKTSMTYSGYVQDEWKLAPTLTFNYGARYDLSDAYRREHQFSPRVNLVWQPVTGTTFHAGYSRYFSPAPFELVATTSVARFVGTSAEAPGTQNDTPRAERQHYFDVGVQQKIGNAITIGLDSYYRRSKNLVDEGQFGAPIILQPFNYERGIIKGVELSLSYSQGPLLAYANLAAASAKGRNIVSSQFAFDPADLAYIAGNYVHLDHDQTLTGSAGFSYAFRDGVLTGTKIGADMLYGSGLRTDGDVPNGNTLPHYVQVNLSVSHRFAGPGISLRFDVINALDHVYQIRDGEGIGVGAPQYGPRRGFFAGITKDL